LNSSWSISGVRVDKLESSLYVELYYSGADIVVEDTHYRIYDRRPIRHWRHLDLWQYKTYLSARVPRYKDEQGFYRSVEVPWSEANEQMTCLLKKK
jgi:transposase